MGRKLRYVSYIYMTGALVMEATLVLSAYENGGFQRAHTLSDLILLAAIYLTAAALWPLLVVTLTLQYFGILPRMMGA
jgi:hypothetical protein